MNYEGQSIINLLKEIKTLTDKCFKKKLNIGSYTMPQTMLIHNLAQHGKMKISELSAKMGLTNSTVSGIVDRLEDQGVVERKRSTSDRRVVHVDLTAQHKNLYQGANTLDTYFNEILKEIPAQDAEIIFSGLTKLKDALEKQMNKNDS